MPEKQVAKPTVSVCLPVRNGESYISASIESVLSQSFTDFELIIADDESSDESANIIESYAARDTRIVNWRNKTRLGLFANYNACLTAASGNYIKLFAQDDVWAPELLAKQVELLERFPKVALVSCKKTLIDGDGAELPGNFKSVADTLGETFLYPAHQVIKACLEQHWDNLLGEPSTVMFRSSYRADGFNTNFKHAGDLEYWLRILQNGDLAMVNEPLVHFRRHKDAATASNVSQLWAYTDIIHLAYATVDALAQIGMSPAQFIAENLRSLAPQIPRLPSGDVDLTGIAEQDEYSARDVAALKKSFLHALSLIPPVERSSSDATPETLEELITEPVKDPYPDILQNQRRIEVAEALLRKILSSGSWRATKPLRELNKLIIGGPKGEDPFLDVAAQPTSQLEQQANYLDYLKSQRHQLLKSRSWKYTKRFRKRIDTSADVADAETVTIFEAGSRAQADSENIASEILYTEQTAPPADIEYVEARNKYDYVVTVHEASRTGAPLLALSFAKCLKERGWNCLIVLQESGVILEEFKTSFDVIELTGIGNKAGALDEKLKSLKELGAFDERTPAFLNSAVCSGLADSFKRHNFVVISLIHEVLSNFSYIERARLTMNSDVSIFSSNLTMQNAKASCDQLGETHVIPQGLLDAKFASLSQNDGRKFLANELGINDDAFIVLACGTADQRKGIDLFPFLAKQVLVNSPREADIHFVWIGGIHTITYDSFWWAQGDVAKLGIQDRVHFVGAQSDIEPYFVGADLFLLCSREDPMPCVLHQAHAAKLPIVAFEGSGGAEDFLAYGGGKLVPYGGIAEMAAAVLHYFHNKELRIADGTIGHQNVLSHHQMDQYVDKLLALAIR